MLKFCCLSKKWSAQPLPGVRSLCNGGWGGAYCAHQILLFESNEAELKSKWKHNCLLPTFIHLYLENCCIICHRDTSCRTFYPNYVMKLRWDDGGSPGTSLCTPHFHESPYYFQEIFFRAVSAVKQTAGVNAFLTPGVNTFFLNEFSNVGLQPVQKQTLTLALPCLGNRFIHRLETYLIYMAYRGIQYCEESVFNE